MSYDIYLVDNFDECLDTGTLLMEGGTQLLGGNSTTMINVTYNYSKWFDFKALHGMSAFDAWTILSISIQALEPDYEVNGDYWEPTEGNVQIALKTLSGFAEYAIKHDIDAHFEVE